MPGPTVNWKKLDTGAWRSEIVEGGRYQLASPSTVTGNPSLAMQAGQSCTVRVYIGGTLYPDASLTVNGTTPVAILNAVGQPLTGQEKFDLVIEVAMPYGENLLTTDEPNGSPTSPFTTTAELPASGAFVNQSILFSLPSVQSAGVGELRWNGSAWVPVGERRIVFAASKDLPVKNVTPGVAAGTPVKIWESEIVPDIFLPNFSQFAMRCLVGVRNPTAQVAGCKLLIGFNGDTPYDYNDFTYPMGTVVTPIAGAAYYRGFSATSVVPKVFQRVGAMFKVGDAGQSSSWPQSNNHGPFTSGANRAQVWVVPSHIADVFQIDLVEVVAIGNI